MTEFMKQEDRSSGFDMVGWALFFIWVGIAWLMGLGLGYGLLGVGILTLGMQGARYLKDLKIAGFWVVVGLAFLAGGFWELWSVSIPLVPVVLIAVGVALLIWRFTRAEEKTDV
jgi:hypothetical protein